ncbi:MAG: DUF4350 domain-containing protein [bacterium]|nr:DUF4350 domain-containing protein [bacterium]
MNSTFSRRTVILIATLCTFSLLMGLALSIFKEELSSVRSTGNDSYSFSALGHRAFKTVLEKTHGNVITSRNHSGEKAGNQGLLILAEPDLSQQESSRTALLSLMCQDARTVLIVLPKRSGISDPLNPRILDSVFQLPHKNSDLILQAIGIEESVIETKHSRSLQWTKGLWKDQPFIEDLHLLKTDDLEPLIACPEGILLGKLIFTEDDDYDNWLLGDIFVLTDPDLLANHGLHQGNNAIIVQRIINHLAPNQELVVFDETLHGHELSPSVMRSFFRIPMVFILLQVLLTAAVFLWMANSRFGSPKKIQNSQGPGMEFLIDNTAELLDFAGHGPFVLGRYFQSSIQSVCRHLRLEIPAGRAGVSSSPAAKTRLINISKKRSPNFEFDHMATEIPVQALENTIKTPETLKIAKAINIWQQEMKNG